MGSYDLIEPVIAAVFVAAFIGLLGYVLWLKHKNSRLANDLVQAMVDKTTMATKLSKALDPANKSIDQTDGFVKFLSESRDSAFNYIEDVQGKIVTIKQDLGPIVEVYRTSEKQTDSMKQVIASYDSLMELLPEND